MASRKPATSDASRYERPSVTVDIVIFTIQERALKLLARGDDPKQVLEALSQGLTNKLMHPPTQALNEATGEERRTLADTLAQLFRLRP